MLANPQGYIQEVSYSRKLLQNTLRLRLRVLSFWYVYNNFQSSLVLFAYMLPIGTSNPKLVTFKTCHFQSSPVEIRVLSLFFLHEYVP